ncbi:MAG: hypothetical protein V1866_05640 [archaeon]
MRKTSRKTNVKGSPWHAILMIAGVIVLVFVIACVISLADDYFRMKQRQKEAEIGDDALPFLEYVTTAGERISQPGRFKLMLDPFTVYRNYPNQPGPGFQTDAHGFRGPNDMETGNGKVFIIGGSAAFGIDIPDNSKTFTGILNSLDLDREFINAGVVGFLSGQELAYITHYITDYDPEAIIVFDGWNDLFTPYFMDMAPIAGVSSFTPGVNPSFSKVEAALLMYRALRDNRSIADIEKNFRRADDISFELVYDTYANNLIKMSEMAKSRGIRFLVVFQPELGAKPFKSQEDEMVLEDWKFVHGYTDKFPEEYAKMIERTERILEERHIAFINIAKDARYLSENQTMYIDPVHFNERGHALIAMIILDKLGSLE